MFVLPGLYQNKLCCGQGWLAHHPFVFVHLIRPLQLQFLLLLCEAWKLIRVLSHPVKANVLAPTSTYSSARSMSVQPYTKPPTCNDNICDRRLDILILQENWFSYNAPPAIIADVASPRFSSMHAHRNESIIGKLSGAACPLFIMMTSISARWRSMPAPQLHSMSS